jgi:nucleotide-binding universal stress UspA family protein
MDQADPQPPPGQPDRLPWRPREDREKDHPARYRQPAGSLDHPVVAGYDGSPPSRHALAYAAGVSRRLSRPLLVVYVTQPGIFCEPMTGQVVDAAGDPADTERWLLAELDEVCDRTGLEVRAVTRRGSPARELAATADESSADALVIGAPGHFWHHLAGSVPGWLARHAHCPVIVVP